MGAHSFQTSANGKSANDAYRKACERATQQYGTDPYNGTISTTNGFQMYQPPEPEDHGPILKLIRKDLGMTQAEFGEIIGRSGGYISCHERGKNPRPFPVEEARQIIEYAQDHEPYKSYRRLGDKSRPALYAEGYRLRDLKQVVKGYWTKEQWSEMTNDVLGNQRFSKRGNCACIQTGEDKYTFIGWAAS